MYEETPKTCSGFSLISLLVATAISLFIMGAAGKIYIDSKNTFNVRNAISAATENGRYAISDIHQTLVMAGRGITASEENTDNTRSLAPLDTSLDTGIYDAGENPDESDIVAVRYRIGPSCASHIDISKIDPDTGIRVPNTDKPPATIRYRIKNDALMCEADKEGDGTFNYKQPITSGIKLMRVLYGVDDDSDGHANRYLTASKVDELESDSTSGSASEKWSSVVSLRIGLIASSDNFEIPKPLQPASPQMLNLLGMPYTAPDKKHIYRAFSTTISLRNLAAHVQRQ